MTILDEIVTLNVETFAFRERELPSILLDSIPEDLRLGISQAVFALARTIFRSPSHQGDVD